VGTTTARGDLSEMEIATALMRAGFTVLRPLSAGRYDLAIDTGTGTFTRVQCKTGILRRGRILFRVCSADACHPLGVPYEGQVDVFGVYCPQKSTAYLVPMAAVAGLGIVASLRVDASRNGQSKGVRYARDYEIKAPSIVSPPLHSGTEESRP
jgi:hypothetical protein